MRMEPATQSSPENLRNALVDGLVQRGAVGSRAVERAFRTVPRHLFVPEADAPTAYGDRPIFLRWEGERPTSSSSQPTIMAIMAEQLQLEPGMRVLEIGTGSGYNAAILSELLGEDGHIVTVDIDPTLVDDARKKLPDAGYGAVEVVFWDGSKGFNVAAPYDRIIVTTGAHDVSPHWIDQLTDGGVLVAPLWFKGFSLSVALEKRATQLLGLSASPCTFIPLRGAWQRSEGYYPIQGRSDQPSSMSIGLDSPGQIDLVTLHNLLSSNEGELRDIGRSLEGHFYPQNLLSGLFLSLTTHPGAFALIPTGQGAPIHTLGYALIAPDLSSAAILNDRFPEQAMLFGDGQAYSELLDLLDHWDTLGHPSIHKLKIHALSESPQPIPEGSWIIPKESDYAWLLSWDI